MDDEISSAYESQLNSQVISTPNHNALVFLYSDDTSEPLQPIELVQSSSVEAAVDKIMAVHNDLDQLQLDSYYVQEELTTFMFRLDDIDTAGDLAAQSLRTNVLAKVQATLKELQTPSSGMLLGEAAASLPLRKNSDAAFFKSEEPLIEFDSPSDTSTNSSEIYYDILHSSSSTDEFFKSVCDNESSWVLEPTQTSDLESSEELRQGCDDIQKSPDAKQEDGAANMILSDTELQTLLSDLNIKVESFDLVEETEQQLEFDADIPQGELVKTSRESSGQASKDSCKSELGSEEGPVQLLLQDADGKFSLNEEALHYVLAPVKDKKLAIVSIVGAFRRGKSFILNFLLRYLKAGGASDWLEGKGENNDLTGFSWRGGRDRDTTGILLWSQPFLMGDDLAVLLMDTQGTFDSLTSMNENAFMFALSTLASSVQIYNLSERIQMDDLQNLQYFLEFGRLVHDASNSKVFSKLLFLVRDWRYPEELKFGFEGGAHLLNEVFKSQVGKMQVEMLNTCFDEVECCLLPHPGEAVFDDQHFKGSPNDMRPEFVSYLWLLVEHIFQPGNLPAKKIGDIFVTGEELQAYLCTFVERLQSSSLSPKTLFQALSNTANERARKKALAFYTKEMEVRLGTTEDIAELHKTLYSQALQMFDSACCFGEDKDTNPHRLFIMELLEDRFNQLVSQFAREEREHANEVRYHLSEAANRAVSQYRLSMELDQSVADLEHSHQQLRVQALMIFEPLLAIYPLHLCKPYISQAKQDIEKLYLAYKVREEKTLKQRRADMLREAHTAAIQNYQLSMEKNGAGVEALPDLEKMHESVFASALAPLHFLHDDSEELGQCLARAAEDIEAKHQMYTARNAKLLELQNDQELMKLTLLSKNALQTYENAMLKLCNSKTTIIMLSDLHIKVREECVAEFQEGTAGCNPEKVTALLQTLQKELEQKFEDVCEEHARKLSDAREKARNRGLKQNYAIGIDLGTTNCCVAVYIDGKVKIITNNIGKTTTPSTVYFEQDGFTFGEAAIMRGFSDPANCVSEMKRIIGRSFKDPVVTSLVPRWSFKVKEGNGDPVIHVTKGKRKQWKPEEISGLVLGEMRRIASVYLDTEIFDAVVTIPAYFNELQREATKRACAQAELNILRIINEPTAAAIAYGVQNPSEQPRTVLVFDFGGGTCDVSILQMENKRYTVMASYGDNKLGGEDFDDILMDHLVQKFEEKHPLKLDQRDKRRLRRQCERAKRDLTDYYEGEIVVERVAGTISDLRETVTRKQFLSLTSHLFPRVLMPVKQCLQDAKLRPSDIDEVVLVGGSSRLLPIQELLSDFFRGKKLHVRTDPDEAIAFGAAIQAAISSGQHGNNPPIIREITPMSLGVGVHGNRMHIITPKNTPLPTKATYRFQTVENYQEEVVIEVYQGENVSNACKNTLLGTFTMHNIRKAPAGQVQLDETFSINEDGILSVTAVEVGTKNVVQVKVQKPVK